MIRKNWGDDGALTLIRVVLERTEDQELREQLLEFLQNNEELCMVRCSRERLLYICHHSCQGVAGKSSIIKLNYIIDNERD